MKEEHKLRGSQTGWLEYNNRCYFFGKSKTWSLAETDCVSRGGHLTSVLDQREGKWLMDRVTNAMKNARTWIGLRRETSGRRWQWADGTFFSSSFWDRGEPNDSGGQEDCVEMYPSGTWNDVPCSIDQAYVCKRSVCPLTRFYTVTCPTPLCPATAMAAATCPTPAPCPICPTTAKPATCPTPAPCPTTAKPATCPTPAPCPTTAKPATCPTPAPCPTTAKPATCPTPAPCPTTAKPATCPTPAPCPTTAKPATCPTPAPCPTTAKAATCPTPAPCPTTAKPATCPTPAPCPTAATTKAAATCPTPAPCPVCPTTAKPATCPASPPLTNGEFQMCTGSTNDSCLLAMIAIPKGGFQDVLDGLSVARSVVIRGRPNPQAKRLVVNLDGRDPNGKKATTALQLDLDLESQTFTLTYRVGGNWGGNRTGDLPRGRPFGAGLPFKIVIECGSGTFHLDFNDELQLDLAGPEFDIGSINWMEVWQVASDAEGHPASVTVNAAPGLGVGVAIGMAIGSVPTCLFVFALACHRLLSAFQKRCLK
ncbi:uncharacterized protein LOC133170731 [Syngnathus typhle]|uniref:uncharacterized protein LOC133170731 n=1 Tax=Syngnathus typhle TaxID=161592 RepID=UPI002A69BE89|nr:uncharacterized protein LOC133170731 [Syngnathus typhle]